MNRKKSRRENTWLWVLIIIVLFGFGLRTRMLNDALRNQEIIIENQRTMISMQADNMRTFADIRAGMCQPWETK